MLSRLKNIKNMTIYVWFYDHEKINHKNVDFILLCHVIQQKIQI